MYGCFQTPGEEIHYTGLASIKAKKNKTEAAPREMITLKFI